MRTLPSYSRCYVTLLNVKVRPCCRRLQWFVSGMARHTITRNDFGTSDYLQFGQYTASLTSLAV